MIIWGKYQKQIYNIRVVPNIRDNLDLKIIHASSLPTFLNNTDFIILLRKERNQIIH